MVQDLRPLALVLVVHILVMAGRVSWGMVAVAAVALALTSILVRTGVPAEALAGAVTLEGGEG